MKRGLTKAQAFERYAKETLQGRKVGRVDVFDDGMVVHYYTGHPSYCGNRPCSSYDKCCCDFSDLHKIHMVSPNRGCPHICEGGGIVDE